MSAVIRTPFLRTAIGIKASIRAILPPQVLKNISAAIIPEMTSTVLERMPLHCFATSTESPGRWKKNPSRCTGTPERFSSSHAVSADPF